jgi:hypothetical protein
MTAKDSRVLLLAGLVVLTALVAVVLNFSGVFFIVDLGPGLWVRFWVPAVLIAGFFGSVAGNNYLRFAGWVGIWYFVLIALRGTVPGDDMPFEGYAGDPPLSALWWRWGMMVTLSVCWILCFWNLRASTSRQPT